jgi:hypothetical protein
VPAVTLPANHRLGDPTAGVPMVIRACVVGDLVHVVVWAEIPSAQVAVIALAAHTEFCPVFFTAPTFLHRNFQPAGVSTEAAVLSAVNIIPLGSRASCRNADVFYHGGFLQPAGVSTEAAVLSAVNIIPLIAGASVSHTLRNRAHVLSF